MRILLVHQYFLEKQDAGGSRFNEMTKIWASQGHQVTVLAGMIHANASKKYPRYKGKFFFKDAYDENITVLRCHVSESYNVNFLGRLWGYFSFVFSSLLGYFFKLKGPFDLVLVTSPPLFVGITGLVISKLKGIPLVFEVRDLWPESAIDTGVLTNKPLIKLAFWFEAIMYKNARLINVLTPAFEKALKEKKQVPASKIIMVPNATDFSLSDHLLPIVDKQKLRKELGWEGQFIIVYVGAHGVANHLEQLLEAADLLRDTPATFVLIGDGMRKPFLKQKAKEMGLENVRFLDPVNKEKVFEYIIVADAGCSALKKVDTFKTIYSNKTFDYMGCKTPILMAIDGISRKLVEEASAGIYTEPENPVEMAEKVRWMMAHQEEIQEMGENGYRYAKENTHRTVLANRYLENLRSIVAMKQ
jgi:glycosyltransferase involved in cell wall biosynthesis